MILQETGWECLDWINLARDIENWRTLMNTVMNDWNLFSTCYVCQEELRDMQTEGVKYEYYHYHGSHWMT